MDSLLTISSDVKYINLYEKLLADILTVYLPGIVTVCRISGSSYGILSDLKILPAIPTVLLELRNNSQDANSLFAGIDLGCTVFIIHQESTISFLDQFIVQHDEATYRNPDKTIILLMDGAQSEKQNLFDELRNHPNLIEVMNLLILRPTARMDTIDLLTHRFVGTAEDSSNVVLLDTFDIANKTFRYGRQLFPDKFSNLQGKSIRLATFNILPFVTLRKTDSSESSDPLVKSGDQMYEMSGINGLMMIEFCRRYNCSVELIIDEVSMWGRIEANKTGNGILGNLAERRADIGFGGMSSWYDALKFLSFSVPGERGGVTCLTPKPVLQPSWRIMLIAFSTHVWLSTIVVFFIILFLNLLMTRLKRTKINKQHFAHSCLNLLAIFILQPASLHRRNVSEVLLSVSLLLFAFNLGNIYSSKNASLRTVPLLGPSIDTIDDLAQSGLPWLQAHEAWAFSLLHSENPAIMKLVSKFQVHSPLDLREFADQGNVAFATARLKYGHLMLGEWITAENVRKYQLMKEDLYFEHEVSMATKTWPLMEQFNKLTMRTIEASIRYYQEQDVIYKHSDFYVQTVAINSHLQEPNAPCALDLTALLGGFFMLGPGMLVAMIVFIVEITKVKSK
ncbi:uncharacterized protein LOC129774216 [Toxorhynchites rutilus septentrionalis]|uniref:uncharacterized protein LOC129774216 n=1 Tax=Toxorhynchites rutilus septentrionalis TaxID=329112 RepID=UPI00247B0DFA|nr:uncharacterized protein LOC129774216 [Toxorhynchites rutilus septentrionalis]